jgi:hypothetical protein
VSDPDGVTNDAPMTTTADVAESPSRQAAEADDRGPQVLSAPDESPGQLTYDDIAARAYDLWVRRGHAPGGDFEDWIRAESELREERRHRS